MSIPKVVVQWGRCLLLSGAPIRLRGEPQLGYKHAKHIMRIELLKSFEQIAGGNDGLG